MDVVYILRAWYDNCLELRYSLRSLENIEHWKVFIIGYKPDWITNVVHIPAEDPYEIKSLNALHKINIACKDERVSDDFILMNDDFYIKDKTEIKYFHQWTMHNQLCERRARWNNWTYVNKLHLTYCLFPGWNDFSIHCPIVYNKDKFLKLQEHYDMTQGYLLRNLYCNHYWIKWEKIEDCKVRNLAEMPKEFPTFFSNLDSLIITDEFKEALNNLFPNASKYENRK